MASTPGYSFVSGETVTPSKLNLAVSNISAIPPAALSTGGPTWDPSGNLTINGIYGNAQTQIIALALIFG